MAPLVTLNELRLFILSTSERKRSVHTLASIQFEKSVKTHAPLSLTVCAFCDRVYS